MVERFEVFIFHDYLLILLPLVQLRQQQIELELLIPASRREAQHIIPPCHTLEVSKPIQMNIYFFVFVSQSYLPVGSLQVARRSNPYFQPHPSTPPQPCLPLSPLPNWITISSSQTHYGLSNIL